MSKLSGFRMVKVFKWMIPPGKKRARYHPVDSIIRKYNCMSRLFTHLRRGAKQLCFGRSSKSGHIQLGKPKPVKVPKGHLAVYVGESDEMTERVLVPVMYFNHPLFGELLKEAERIYGFNPPGGITIPCRISEFEKVKKKIASWDHDGGRK